MDPVETINTEKDTTFVLMLEAQARGHEVWYLELKDMFVKETQAYANATPISLERSEEFYKNVCVKTCVTDSITSAAPQHQINLE